MFGEEYNGMWIQVTYLAHIKQTDNPLPASAYLCTYRPSALHHLSNETSTRNEARFAAPDALPAAYATAPVHPRLVVYDERVQGIETYRVHLYQNM